MQLILSLNTPTTRKSTAYEPLYFDKNAKVPYFKKKKKQHLKTSVSLLRLLKQTPQFLISNVSLLYVKWTEAHLQVLINMNKVAVVQEVNRKVGSSIL